MPPHDVNYYRAHTLERIAQRYNLCLTLADYNALLRRIENRAGVVHLQRTKQRYGQTRLAVLYCDIWLVVVYDHGLRCIMTALPQPLLRFAPKKARRMAARYLRRNPP